MRKQIRLLIVDDSPGYSELLKDSSDIWNEYYEVLVTHVATASEAVHQIAAGGAHVVMVDAHLSCINTTELDVTVREWGAADYIAKTADPDEVENTLMRLAELSTDTLHVH
jgi:DNA-binding response OmpR family regulator